LLAEASSAQAADRSVFLIAIHCLDGEQDMLRVICVAVLAGMVCGCAASDQTPLYSQSAKPRQVQVARTTPDAGRPARVAEPQRAAKTPEPQIVLGAAY
jgi:hypothetical protein